MNYGLCLPSGTIFHNQENVMCTDIISYDDFLHEVNYLIEKVNYPKEGLYAYYEGHNKIYEINYESKGE